MTLEAQDRSKWDRARIAAAIDVLDRAVAPVSPARTCFKLPSPLSCDSGGRSGYRLGESRRTV